jgi:hypothetical protein
MAEAASWSGGFMRREDIAGVLSNRAFEFFYWYSRFEFALKENRYLKTHLVGAKAEPGWDEFVAKWRKVYVTSPEAQRLAELNPETQTVGTGDQIEWTRVDLSGCTSPLEATVRLIKIVRNNLFHGGKHGHKTWDNPARAQELIDLCIAALEQLAVLSSIDSDYKRYY